MITSVIHLFTVAKTTNDLTYLTGTVCVRAIAHDLNRLAKHMHHHPHFTPEEVGKVAPAAKHICTWVHATFQYSQLQETVTKDEEALRLAAEEVAEMNRKLAAKAAELAEVDVSEDIQHGADILVCRLETYAREERERLQHRVLKSCKFIQRVWRMREQRKKEALLSLQSHKKTKQKKKKGKGKGKGKGKRTKKKKNKDNDTDKGHEDVASSAQTIGKRPTHPKTTSTAVGRKSSPRSRSGSPAQRKEKRHVTSIDAAAKLDGVQATASFFHACCSALSTSGTLDTIC
eukprot:SAG11_NODE_44_length_20765_cov_5.183635_10_plen_288_part_00